MQDLKSALLLFLTFTIICGGIYPALVTGVAQVVFPQQAAGSFITDSRGNQIGSALIGQPFSDLKYFWPRPSASADFGYNPLASGGSNAGPTNPAYLQTVAERVKALRASGITAPLPTELVQASASGLDPHISPEAAWLQVPRVATARGLSAAAVLQAVTQLSEERHLGILGAPRVNVLLLNLELDRLTR
jgi:K+-transporting ATPase ATPase C chain